MKLGVWSGQADAKVSRGAKLEIEWKTGNDTKSLDNKAGGKNTPADCYIGMKHYAGDIVFSLYDKKGRMLGDLITLHEEGDFSRHVLNEACKKYCDVDDKGKISYV